MNSIPISHKKFQANINSVVRGLAPVGLRSGPKFYDCYAAERGQAPSPQGSYAGTPE